MPRKHIQDLNVLKALLSRFKKIVATTGAFDYPHKGHIDYLAELPKFGTVSVLFLQSDRFIKERKGPERPERNERIRIQRMHRKTYKSVDYIFVVDTKEELYAAIEFLHPKTLILSETTTDEDTCAITIRSKISEDITIVVLKAMSKTHSTDLIEKRKLKQLKELNR